MATEAEIDQFRRQLEAKFANWRSMKELMDLVGLSQERVDQELEKEVLRTHLRGRVASGVEPAGPDDVERYYNENIEDFEEGETVRLLVISVLKPPGEAAEDMSRLRAELVLSRVEAGEDFQQLAVEVSDHATASQGGDTGFIDPLGLPEPVRDAVADLPAGEMTGLVETRNGWVIAKVVGRRNTGYRPLHEIFEPLRARIDALNVEDAYQDLMAELKSEADIVRYQ